MSDYRSDFFVAMSGLISICDEPLLTDVLPLEDRRNVNSKILRKGIAVSSFVMLETYIKDSFELMMDEISKTSIKYRDFTEKMRTFISVNAVEGLSTHLYFIKDKTKKLSLIDGHISELSGYLAEPPRYTALGFSPRGSNIGHDDIKNGFNAIGLSDPWAKLNEIVTSFGASSLSLKNDFETISSVRHASAHDVVGNIPTEDLKSHLRATVVVGMAVDILARHVGAAIHKSVKASDIGAALSRPVGPFRFLEEDTSGSWLERSMLNGRCVKKYANVEAAKAGASGRAQRAFVVLRDRSGLPIELLL